MSQEITIIVLVDIQAAIKTKSLEGNIYLMDNLRTDGSTGEGTGKLITAIDGSYWCDGSQSCDIVMNWLISGIGSLPVTLPHNYYHTRSKHIEDEWIQSIKNAHLGRNTAKKETNFDTTIIEKIGAYSKLRTTPNKVIDIEIKSLNIFGEHFDSSQNKSSLNPLPPQISNITGCAVDDKVLFPAQYGTPVPIKDGWYWSATVDTSKTGLHNYTLHITLYDFVNEVWTPVELTYDAQINVSNNPVRNGFTNAGLGLIPLMY
ncbi:MAG TPA: hypothetical protein VIK29_05230 [Paludibacter sp.]